MMQITKTVFCLSLVGASVLAQPVINEFMASNQTIYPDNRDFDDYSDWIELYNPTSTSIPLTDYYLTDDLELPLRWRFPEGASIPAGGFLMVRADGFNAGPGEVHVRDYWPWGSTLTTQRYHAGFKLSADGESIGLFRLTAPARELTMIETGSVWKYLDTGVDPGPDWTKNSFDDSGWSSGPSELGYGDGNESTVIGYGPDSRKKYPTTFFRTRFTVSDPAVIGDIRFNVKIDDGAIFYLNGEEAARIRMPEGPVDYLDLTSLGGDEYGFEAVDIPASLLRAGENVLAIEVHQASASSSDLSMDAELVIYEVDPEQLVLVDAIAGYPAQMTDVSYGRDPLSDTGWSFFAEATPEAANTSEPLVEAVQAEAIVPDMESGFYFDPIEVSFLAVETNITIRYTLDGSVPDSDSAVYSAPITIAETTVLRARAFVSGRLPGPVATRSYFIDENPALSVISLAADPETLFGNTIGIVENNTAYPFKGREVPVHLDMFEADQSPAFSVNAGARIGGENIWDKAQKPFNIYMRSKYGDDTINYQMFPGQPYATFGELMLRNGGDDWAGTLLRDALMPSILEGRTESGLYTYRPSIMFINGDFWGIYNIRKRFDPVYFANEQALAEGEYDLVQWAHVGSDSVTLNADIGSTERYEAFRTFYMTNDTSNPAIYSQIEEQMDVDSFLDYIISTDYAANTSWSWNREFWCGYAEGSKWHWIINDFDRGFDSARVQGSIIDDFRNGYTLFQRLDNNTAFVNRLLQRYAAHLGSTFQPQRISDILDVLSAEQSGEIERHIARWSSSGGIASLIKWQSELEEIKQFVANRPPYALSRLQEELGLSLNMADLTIGLSHDDGGRVLVAGVPMLPEYNSTFHLFANVPVELCAEPAPGYAFSRWSNGNTNSTIEITLLNAQTITAQFVAGAETIIPSQILSDTTLTAAGSPYSVTNDLVVEAGHTLTLGPGTTLLMPPEKSIIVHGQLDANGTETLPIEIRGRGGKRWGNLSFVNTTGESSLSYVTIRDATASRQDPLNLKAAVSGYDSDLTLDHVDIDALQPIFARYGSTTLNNCRIHIRFTGDGINIKSGNGAVVDSTFTGNPSPDTDAIDFDNVPGGLIQGNRIYAFLGFNSDAIDVGEGCQDLMVVSNRIFNITDKGVSVGQASVAYIERNLIVDCDMGVGVKDAGSTAYIDQNTFARNNYGVSVYEKNPGAGGGIARVENSIFSRIKTAPVSIDNLSSLSVAYSLSDTLALDGMGNLLADPLFADEGSYDFSLTSGSPAWDSGNPTHALDSDGSRADMGAYYLYDPEDYPYYVPNRIVINEVMAHSHDAAPDWIELHNTSAKPVDLGGWFLSDDPDNPMKYRIADGTFVPGNGFVVFSEDENFGASSGDAGVVAPFALSENGDTVFLLGLGDELSPDYTVTETFGASLSGVTMGRYYKASTHTNDFISLETPTPGDSNSDPMVGPVVFGEIMYHPPVGEAEYIELVNIDPDPVVLFDGEANAPWRMTQGIDHLFSSTDPVVMQPGERIILVRNAVAYAALYGTSSGARLIQWDSGSLDNAGETLEISRPGDTNEVGELQYVRVDRVDYSDLDPWPAGPDGEGDALARINERAYGNDYANWRESFTTPGQTEFLQWRSFHDIPAGLDGPADDPDGDGIKTAIEYASGTDPMTYSAIAGQYAITPSEGVEFTLPVVRPDLGYAIQKASSLVDPDWTDLPGTVSMENGQTLIEAFDQEEDDEQAFYRLKVILNNDY